MSESSILKKLTNERKSNLFVDETASFESICIEQEQPLNPNHERILFVQNNIQENTINVNVSYFAEIHSGNRLVIKEERIPSESMFNSNNLFTDFSNNDIIKSKSLGNYQDEMTEFPDTYKFFSKIKNLNEQHDEDVKRINELEKELKVKNSELKNSNEVSTDIICKEDTNMKKSVMYDVLKEQLKFLMTSVAFIILSLIGIIVFIKTGKYLIHPYIYIITLLMGIGWGLTAIFSIKGNRM